MNDKSLSIKKASVIYAVSKYSVVVAQLLLTAILSRILTPEDYGIVAIVTVFTTFFTTLSNLGLGTAVTQYQDLTADEVQDIFTFSEFYSLAMGAICAISSFPIAFFYEDTVYIPIVFLLSISVFFNAIDMVPNALLMKSQRFVSAGFRMVVCTAIGGIVAIAMALMGLKYYALVGQSIVYSVCQFIWNVNGTGLKFRIAYNKRTIKKISSYSNNQFAYNIFNYLAQNLDNLLTGKVMGSRSLAYYNKAYTLMRYPVTNIAHVITPILHPILARHQADKNYIYHHFIELVKIMSLLGTFITVFCYWSSKEIILCYFGNQWRDSIIPFKLLSVCIAFQLMNAMFGAIYQSIGCTREMFHSGIFHISISVVAIIIGAFSKDVSTLAALVSLSMIVKFFVESYFLVKKCFELPLIMFFKEFIPDILILTVMSMICELIGEINLESKWLILFAKLGICGLVFFSMLLLTGQIHYFTRLVPTKFRKRMKNHGI